MPIRLQDPIELATHLVAGEVVLMRTDTLPGLHARADDDAAVQRIMDIKGRDDAKPLLLLCSATAEALSFVSEPLPEALSYAAACWPGPFTLILPAGPDAPRAATRGQPTVALRVPAPRDLRTLIEAAGGVLVSTSVNRTGEPALHDLGAAIEFCGAAVDVVGDVTWEGAGDESSAGASGLLDLTRWPPRVVRPGGVVPPSW